MKEAEFENIRVEEFLSNAEYMIMANPDMDGLELTDTEGRVWFIQLLEGQSTLN